MADCIIAGGAESMSAVPMTGFKTDLNYDVISSGHEDYYWGMGNTAEAVANQYNVSRQDQDEFAYNSHQKALKAQAEDRFQSQIAPITVDQTYIDANGKKAQKSYTPKPQNPSSLNLYSVKSDISSTWASSHLLDELLDLSISYSM